MGIQLIETPLGQENQMPGPLTLPVGFDGRKWAAKWVKDGTAVAAAGVREIIHGTRLSADGWIPWKDEEGRPYKVPLQSGVFILLCRDRSVQDDVNSICGNVGKRRLVAERKLETIDGNSVTDPGMLSDETLARATGVKEVSEDETGDVKENIVQGLQSQRIEPRVVKTTATVHKKPIKRAE